VGSDEHNGLQLHSLTYGVIPRQSHDLWPRDCINITQ